ncbi:hypothetical protein ACFW9O_05865 [Streptomyces sp. NPDC059499]|uniref:hypothetical protein n=1 Tax=Streptomyces sp. NPDC059499 TaxID=3346852 RepID=UPI0036CBE25B
MTSTLVNLICACGEGSSHNCPLEWDPQRLHSAVVRGCCPACGQPSLFLGAGGYVTCRRLECPQPDAASTLLERP